MTDGDRDAIAPDAEVSPYNADAVRGSHGIWNEESLLVVDWEEASQRVVVPSHLRDVLGIDTPVLRWSKTKRRSVLREHRQDIERRYLANVEEFLDQWAYAGPQPGLSDTWRIFVEDQGRWSMAVFGTDERGSTNMITLYSPKRRSYIPNLIERGDYTRRK